MIRYLNILASCLVAGQDPCSHWRCRSSQPAVMRVWPVSMASRSRKRIADAGDSRRLTATGTLYRALQRLDDGGLIENWWEDPDLATEAGRPRRRLYRITGPGAAARQRRIRRARTGVAPSRPGVRVLSARLDRSTRLVRWWVRRYTAGLDQPAATFRRGEVDSDLAEHTQYRRGAGWSAARIGRERVHRFLFGVPADVGWRRDQLRARGRQGATSVLSPVTTLASLLLATYYVAFAAYLLGSTALADERVWGRAPMQGFVGYEDQAGAVVIFGGAGLVLAIATVARPIAPVVANVMTLPIAVMSVLLFWLGVWPLGLVVCAGAAADLAVRAPRTVPP